MFVPLDLYDPPANPWRQRAATLLGLAVGLGVVGLAVYTTWAASSFGWSKGVDVQNSSAGAIANQQVIVSIDNAGLVSGGFLNASGTDSDAVNSGGTSVPFMLADDKTILFDSSVDADGELFTLQFDTGSDQTDFFILTGRGGFITTTDAAALEPGSDFEIEIKGYLDTDAGSGDILLKTGAIQIVNTAAGEITATVTLQEIVFEPDDEDAGEDDDDGEAQTFDPSTYPPAAFPSSSKTLTSIATSRKSGGVDFTIENGLVQWDTDSLVGLTISNAELRIKTTSVGSVDGTNFMGEYYTVGTISTSDYSFAPASTSFSAAISSIGSNSENVFTLTAPDANINKTGQTGLRFHVDGGQPTGSNSVLFAATEHTTDHPAQLAISSTAILTATGLSAGEHTLALTYDGTTLTLNIDDATADSLANSLISVVDTANNWAWVNDNTVHYVESLKVSVPSSTLVMHYQPVEVITGTTLPDEAGGDNSGTFTFGSNNASITATTSALAAGSIDEASDGESSVIVATPAPPTNLTDDGADVTNIPFFGIIDQTASSTGIAGLRDFLMMFIATAALVFVGGLAVMLTRSLEITAIIVGVAFAFFWLIGVFPWWFMPGYGVLAGALILGRRMVYT